MTKIQNAFVPVRTGKFTINLHAARVSFSTENGIRKIHRVSCLCGAKPEGTSVIKHGEKVTPETIGCIRCRRKLGYDDPLK